MDPMSPEIAVLRALLRLARRRTPASLDEILVRVGVDAPSARRALASLARAGLVHRTVHGPRLTLSGFAIAVATAAAVPAKRPASLRRTVLPLVRRRPAA
jgi:DNA-binding IclR family transcriptional regulator